jgi:hypothetical protein
MVSERSYKRVEMNVLPAIGGVLSIGIGSASAFIGANDGADTLKENSFALGFKDISLIYLPARRQQNCLLVCAGKR